MTKYKEYRCNSLDKKIRIALSLFMGKVTVKSILAIGFGPAVLYKILKQRKVEVKVHSCSIFGLSQYKDKEISFAICLDTLEHLPPKNILHTLREINRVSRACFFIIAVHGDKISPLVGRPQHRTVRNANWWKRQLRHVGYKTITETDKQERGELRVWAL